MTKSRLTLIALLTGFAAMLLWSPQLAALAFLCLTVLSVPIFMRRSGEEQPVRRVVIYGGTYGPIHNGHLTGAEWIRCLLTGDVPNGSVKVHFVLSANPPHKNANVLPAEARFEMLDAAVAPNKYFVADRTELLRPGKSYTIDTVKEFRRKYGPNVELFLVLGSEYLDPEHPWYLPKWGGIQEITSECTILMFPRLVNQEQSHAAGIQQVREWIGKLTEIIPHARIVLLENFPILQISSTLIRDRVRDGQSVWYMVPYEVSRLIRDRGHYLPEGHGPRVRTPLAAIQQTAAAIGRELKYFWNSIA